MSLKPIPALLYYRGDSHERAAWIELGNTTEETLLNIKVHRHDVGSWDKHVSEGYLIKDFERFLPGELTLIDELSSFDLEYKNSYSITYQVNEQAFVLTFTIEKYGVFEHEESVAVSLPTNGLLGIKKKLQ